MSKNNKNNKKGVPICHINWNVKKSFSTARCFVSSEDRFVGVPNSYLNQKIRGFKKGDHVAVFYRFSDNKIMYTELITGPSMKSFFKSIERGMNRVLKNSDMNTVALVYEWISKYFHPKERLRLVHLFESNKLKIKDLIGDHNAYAGGLKRNKKGIWIFGLDS